MKYILIGLLALFSFEWAYAQKPAIDTAGINCWTRVDNPAISNNGKFAVYNIVNQPYKSNTLVVKAVAGGAEQRFIGGESAIFTQDSRKLICKKGDSLLILTLGKFAVETITKVSSFELLLNRKVEQLLYLQTDAEHTLSLRDSQSGKTQKYTGIELYTLSKDRKVLLLKTTDRALKVLELASSKIATYRDVDTYQLSENGQVMLLQRKDALNAGITITRVDRLTGQQQEIWSGESLLKTVMDWTGKQLAFESENQQKQKNIWQYQHGMKKAEILLLSNQLEPDEALVLGYQPKFSEDGRLLFCSIIQKQSSKAADGDCVQVDVWSYTDVLLQSQQLSSLKKKEDEQRTEAMLDIRTKKLNRLINAGEQCFKLPGHFWSVTRSNGGNFGTEYNWNKDAIPEYFVIDTRTGLRKPVPTMPSFYSSPDGHYVLLWGISDGMSFHSYELASGKVVNLTGKLPVPLGDASEDRPANENSRGFQFGLWLTNHTALIYDRYDIWKIDVSGAEAPVSLTHDYGRKNNITFRLASDKKDQKIDLKKPLLLSAFNNATKDNGFYQLNLSKSKDPELLSMGPYVFMAGYAEGSKNNGGMPPLKARDAQVWLVERSSTAAAPNLFITRDFKRFSAISDVHPEQAYNWLSSELINFKTLDGKNEQGVLYRPENFDPEKKYPIIFYYYEKLSGSKNNFWAPGLSQATLNIPWYVSRGYLVFTPDIHYKIGEPMKSAYNRIVGAAKHLMGLPFVEAKRMGLQGHSWGGFETNYVVTHSHLFAAACSGAGEVNFVSGYGGLRAVRTGDKPYAGEGSNQFFYENHQTRMGSSLWERPDQYIENSPVFNADKVTTPLLIMHNKNDGAVNFAQGMEWFTALRRMGKKAWLLQYDGEDHFLSSSEKNILDFTHRMDQFFDHYLKGAPAPIWMTRGISASRKGLDTGYEYDTEIKTPGPGLNTPEDQKKIDEYSKIPFVDKLKRLTEKQ
ncbi:MAG: prolyl oligopeptidase family serine peptidase [Candidatus Pedobacter colombiensis]|uniref:Prolyl oligopeptidase family serine peptidase n=1 Tax=Candidatus Pedobacter colombiensis TaxID=3121371 RepID=A0AAJ5WB51_9SPHI|nr:prolyl oligopeptidase family serine peptidase [Pedobacter sp.]WEK20411.1 MAG: prolyl oligopeptidase family serine peptidase [Pedobacter sp.]